MRIFEHPFLRSSRGVFKTVFEVILNSSDAVFQKTRVYALFFVENPVDNVDKSVDKGRFSRKTGGSKMPQSE